MTEEVPCSRQCRGRLTCKRVVRAGVTYRCAAALANALGVSPGAVYMSFRRHGNAEHCGIPKGVKPGTRLANYRKPMTVGPHSWPSITAMAADLGTNRKWIGRKMKSAPMEIVALVMRVKK
jgi:hypothetical protein